MLRVCLLGSGSFAREHATWWRRQPGARLVAVAGRDAGRLAADPAWAGLEIHDESAIAEPGRTWDLVDIVTPPGRHAAQAIAALAAGYHVLSEKPLATSSVDAERMIAAAVAADRRLFVVSQYRFVPAYRVIKSAVSRKRPTSIRIEYTMPPEAAGLVAGSWKIRPEISGGGILWSSGVHLVDLLLWWLGPPDEASDKAPVDAPDEVPDEAPQGGQDSAPEDSHFCGVTGETACELPGIHVESRYEARWTAGGCAVELVSRCAACLPHRTTVDIRGDRVSARIVDWRVQRSASPLSWKLQELVLGVAEKLRPHRRDPLGRQFAEIIAAISTRRPSCVDAEAGLRAVRVLEQIAKSTNP